MKRWLKRNLPAPQRIIDSKPLRVFGKLLRDPNLWHLNRRSVSGGVAVGLFCMYMPPVGQPLMATAAAIRFRVNLPIAFSLVWISNPLTIPPMFYLSYRIGAWLLDRPVLPFKAEFWLDIGNWLGVLWPVLLGSFVCASVLSIAGFFGVQLLWRWNLHRQIRERRARYAAALTRMPSSKRKT